MSLDSAATPFSLIALNRIVEERAAADPKFRRDLERRGRSVLSHARTLSDEALLEKWYVGRFMRLHATAFRDPRSYFHKFAELSDEEAVEMARDIWTRINLRNLWENVLPTRARASLILTKGVSHAIEEVALRKL